MAAKHCQGEIDNAKKTCRSGIDPAISKAQRVSIHTRQGSILGVVGNVAPHLTRGDAEAKLPKIHEIFIDIGVTSKAEALQLVRIGDPITLNDRFEMLRGDLAVARAFDNRIGTFAVAEALRYTLRCARWPTFRRRSGSSAPGRSPTP